MKRIVKFWKSAQCAELRHSSLFEELVGKTFTFVSNLGLESRISKNKLCLVFNYEGKDLYVKPIKYGFITIFDGVRKYYQLDNSSLDFDHILDLFMDKYDQDVAFEEVIAFFDNKNVIYELRMERKWNKNIYYIHVPNYGTLFFNRKSITVLLENGGKKMFK